MTFTDYSIPVSCNPTKMHFAFEQLSNLDELDYFLQLGFMIVVHDTGRKVYLHTNKYEPFAEILWDQVMFEDGFIEENDYILNQDISKQAFIQDIVSFCESFIDSYNKYPTIEDVLNYVHAQYTAKAQEMAKADAEIS